MSDPPVFLFSLFNGVFVSLDHLLDHLTADRACFAGGQVTVLALLQVDADLVGSFHLKFVHCFLRLWNDQSITVRVVMLHTVSFAAVRSWR